MKVRIRVHPGTSRERLFRNPDNSFVAYLTKRAVKSEANKALIKLLAKHFHLAKSRITIVQGEKSRFKIVQIG